MTETTISKIIHGAISTLFVLGFLLGFSGIGWGIWRQATGHYYAFKD